MRRIAHHGWRQLLVLLVLLLTLSLLVKNLFVLQVLQAGSATMLQHYREEVVSPQVQQPRRGTIVDARGISLVATVPVYKLGAYPELIAARNKVRAARAITEIIAPLQLAPTLDVRAAGTMRAAHHRLYEAILAQLNKPYPYVCLAGDDSDTCPLHEDISTPQHDRVINLKLPGFDLELRSKPDYPNGGLASQILGFVNYVYPYGQAEDTGNYGLEEFYNQQLRGVSGRVSERQDTAGNIVRVGLTDAAAQQGAQLRLWMDSFVQLTLERMLRDTVKRFNATGGSVVVERPSDGAVLAMTSVPSYDPRTWQKSLKKTQIGGQTVFTNPNFQNAAVSGQYEPGSTFKPIMASIGYDAGAFGEWLYRPDNGVLKQDGIAIRDWCLDSCSFAGKSLNVADMLHWSSNIAATEFANLIPTITFYKYLDSFGFGQPTGVDLANEATGTLRHPTDQPPLHSVFVPAYKDTTAYGQGGIAVTPLQLVNAYSALANGGRLMTPHLVQSVALGNRAYAVSPHVQRRVVSVDTSNRITNTIVQSAIGGEACRALVPGYDIAAKTGTTLLSALNITGPTVASTIAYGPVNISEPGKQFVVLVKLDRPSNTYGSETAAPLAHDILSFLFNYYKIAPWQGYVSQPSHRCAQPLQLN